MSACDLLGDWDDIGPGSLRTDGMEDFITGLLETWGYDAIDVELQDQDEDCKYDLQQETVFIDPDFLAETDAETAFDCAIHETVHAAQHQSGIDLGGMLPEFEAQILASQLLQELMADCESGDVPESGAEGNLPENPWECVLGP